MKIGIITQPLAINYGGLLQNFALQKVLTGCGHKVYTINKDTTPHIYNNKWSVKAIFYTKQIIKKMLGRRYTPSYKQFMAIRGECQRFIKENIAITEAYNTQQELSEITNKYGFEVYIAGSDQIWRPIYSKNIFNDFLDFCQEKKNIKRIAYAASFGVDSWEFTDEQTERCSQLAKLFNAVSVREYSGIELCKEHLGVEATIVLDPTLLLEKEEYIKLIEQHKEEKSQGELFCYILDKNKKVQNAINSMEQKLSLKSFQVKAKKTGHSISPDDNIEDYIIPSPTKWLRAFMDAKMVFTDSFHGCVFSIIFNKPFWVIGNKERGNARFESLLKLFDLESRRVDINDIYNIDLRKEIDWNIVNRIKKEWQTKSFEFLSNYSI